MEFGNQVDNSKLTPEFHQAGQGQQVATDNNQQQNLNQNVEAPQGGQASNAGNQIQNNNNNVEGIQVGDEVFATQEDLIAAYNDMKANLETRNNSYKELQSAYTKSRQEIAIRNKMARPENAEVQPTGVPFNQPVFNNPYRPPVQPYGGVQPFVGVNPQMAAGFNNPYLNQIPRQSDQSSAVVNEAMINMAIENKIVELKSADPNFDEVAGELWNIMDTDKYFSRIKFTDPEMAKNSIEAAYQLAKQKVETAKANIKANNARTEAYNAKQTKVLNNDVSNVANRGKGQQTEKTDAEKIKEEILGAKPLRF